MPKENPFPPEFVEQRLAGRFKNLEILRIGGQGVVYRAETSGNCVALKFYIDSKQNERVEREIRALEGFDHPNLAKLVEHGSMEQDGKKIRFVAWKFIEGSALDYRLKGGAVPVGVVACIGRDISRAIAHIWTKRIVHRDINPKNIILRENEREAILIDLGVAKHLSEATLTSPGLTWGTFGYLSPEQCRAESQLTCQSDVFSLGIVLQEALCGHHPTGGDQSLIVQRPRRTCELMPHAPAALAALIDSMLGVRAAFRPIPEVLAASFANLASEIEG